MTLTSQSYTDTSHIHLDTHIQSSKRLRYAQCVLMLDMNLPVCHTVYYQVVKFGSSYDQIPICEGRILNLCVVWMWATIYNTYAAQETPACPVSMDLVIAIDASTSIGYYNFQLCKDFVKDIVNSADIDGGNVRVGIMIYSYDVEIILNLNNGKTKQNLKKEISNIHYIQGGTYIGYAIEHVMEMFSTRLGDRPDVENVAFVLTDGESSDDITSSANAAHSQGITIYAFGIGDRASRKNLREMASKPAREHIYTVNSFSEMYGLGDDLFSTMCSGIASQATTTKVKTTQPETTTTTQPETTTTTTPYSVSTLATTHKDTTTMAETTELTTYDKTSTESGTVQITTTKDKTTELTTNGQTSTQSGTVQITTKAETPELTTYSRTSTETITAQDTTGVVSNVQKCRCPCDIIGDIRYVNLTASQMMYSINDLRRQLLRNKNSLSSWRRKLTSADDDRYSARLLGIILSTGFICMSLAFILLLDFDRYIRWFEKKFRKGKVEDES